MEKKEDVLCGCGWGRLACPISEIPYNCPVCGFSFQDMKNLDFERQQISLKESVLDGKRVAYSSETEFLVQVGKGKSSYKTRYRTIGNFSQAVLLYKGINIGNGFKKRLVSWNMNKPVLAFCRS